MGLIDSIATRIGKAITPHIDSRIAAQTKDIERRLTDPILAEIVGWKGGDDKKVNKPYAQIAAIYAAINAKAHNIAGVPWKIYKKDSRRKTPAGWVQKVAQLKEMQSDEITTGPIVQLFNDVNPTMSKYQLWEAIVTNLDINGKWIVLKDTEAIRNGVPAFLYVYSSDRWKPAYRANYWVGWELERGGQATVYPLSDVIYDRYYNPYDEIDGLSPLEAAKTSYETDYYARKYNRNFFDNDATPPVTFETDSVLTNTGYQRLKNDLIEARTGVDQAHRALILDNGLKANKIGLSQKDIEFISQINLTIQDICMIYRVPKNVIAVYEDTNYATALSADRGFWIKTLIPLMTKIEDKFNQEFLNDLGYEGRFDITAVDAINYAFLEKVDAATKLYQIGFTANEINNRLDLGFTEQPWRDEPFSMFGPVDDVSSGDDGNKHRTPAGVKDLQPGNLNPSEAVKALRAAKWKSINGRVLPLIGKMNREVRTYFHEVEKRILADLTKSVGTIVTKDKDVDVPEDFDDFFSDRKLQKIFQKYALLSINTGIQTIIKDNWEYVAEEALSRVSKRALKVTEVNKNARSDIRDALQLLVREIINEGLSEQQAAERIVERMKSTMSKITSRAKTIARTEVHGAYSEGRYLAMEETKPPRKMWLSSRDSKVRDTHDHLDGVKIPFGKKFANGLEYPQDPDGAAGEVINCRCELIPLYDEEG